MYSDFFIVVFHVEVLNGIDDRCSYFGQNKTTSRDIDNNELNQSIEAVILVCISAFTATNDDDTTSVKKDDIYND